MPVTVNRAWPAASVVTEAADSALLAADLIATTAPAMAVPAELRRLTVNSLAAWATSVAGPLSESWVPVTATGTLFTRDPVVAVTVMVRLAASEIDSVAVAVPLASVRALTTCSTEPVSVVANFTSWLAIDRFEASLTIAVMEAVVRPSEPMEGTLVVTCTAAGSEPDELLPENPKGCAPAPEPPPPPQAASETISSSASIAAISRDIRLDSIGGVMCRFSVGINRVGMTCVVMAGGLQRAAAATSFTTLGVRKTSSSVRSLRRCVFLKALPITGRSPSSGTLLVRLRSICS